jgi:hypothetical protein
MTRDSRRRGRVLAQRAAWCLMPWQLLRRAMGSRKGSRWHSEHTRVRGTRPEDGGSPASLSAPAAKQGGYDGESPEWRPRTGGEDFSTQSVIPEPCARIQTPVTRIAARVSSAVRTPCAGGLICFGHCTMALLQQSAWQSRFSADLLPIWCSDRASSLYRSYSLINQLSLCYMVYSQKITGSYPKLNTKFIKSHCPWKFRLKMTWQPIFRLNYL